MSSAVDLAGSTSSFGCAVKSGVIMGGVGDEFDRKSCMLRKSRNMRSSAVGSYGLGVGSSGSCVGSSGSGVGSLVSGIRSSGSVIGSFGSGIGSSGSGVGSLVSGIRSSGSVIGSSGSGIAGAFSLASWIHFWLSPCSWSRWFHL